MGDDRRRQRETEQLLRADLRLRQIMLSEAQAQFRAVIRQYDCADSVAGRRLAATEVRKAIQESTGARERYAKSLMELENFLGIREP